MRYQLTFALNEQDYFEYNKHFLKNTASSRRMLTMARISISVLALALATFIAFVGNGSVYGMIICAIVILFGGYWLVFFDKIIDRSVRKSINKLKKTGRTLSTKEVTCVFSDSKIRLTTANGATSMNYSSFIGVVAGKAGVYLYQTSKAATIVPNRAFSDDAQKEAVVRFLESKIG